MTEPRKYKRVPVRVPVYISLGGDVYAKMIPLECRDLSGGGLSFETGQEVPLEADSRVLVGRLGNLPGAAHIEGRIARRQEDPKTGRYVIAVEFTKFVDVTREELLAHIDEWAATSPSV